MNKIFLLLIGTILGIASIKAQSPDLSPTARIMSLSERQRKDNTIFADPSLRLKEIGVLKNVPSKDIKSSIVSIGFECLDRYIFEPDSCYDKLAATGVKWARCQTGWNRCETQKGVYNFAWLDSVVDNLLQRGIQPWFNVGFGNKIYMPEAFGEAAVGWVPLYFGDEVKKAWGNYINALAKHFNGRVSCYELWNEPNINNFWQPGKANAKDYLKLISYTSDIIKTVDPKAQIGACVSGSFSSFVVDLAKLGVAKYIDFFSIHPYRVIPEKGYETELRALRQLFDRYDGEHIELWQGEVGFGSYFPPGHFLHTWTRGSENLQARWLLRRFALDQSLGLKVSSFFQMVDMNGKQYETSQGTQDPCLHGILNGRSYTPKEAYYAISNYATLFDNTVQSSNLYMAVDWTRRAPMDARISRLSEVAVRYSTYERDGYPVLVYYLPEDVQMQYPGLAGINIHVITDNSSQMEQPILIDMLSGRVFAVTDISGANNIWKDGMLNRLPLTDYPLVITDLAAYKDRITMYE